MSIVQTSPQASINRDARTEEFLTFVLGTEHYAIDILKVREIRGYEQPTQIANAPSFIKGVLNLRETMVPIIDLRIKFNLPAAEYGPFTVTLILNIADSVVGVVVDQVTDVITLSSDQIRQPPAFSGDFDTKYIIGLANVDQRMLIVSDIDRLLNCTELGQILDDRKN